MTARTVRQARKSSKKSRRPGPKKANGAARKPGNGNGAASQPAGVQAEAASISPEHAAYLEDRKKDASALVQHSRLALGLDSEHEDGVNLHSLIRTLASGGQGSTKTVADGALSVIEGQAEALFFAVEYFTTMSQIREEPHDVLVRGLLDISARARAAGEIERRRFEAISEEVKDRSEVAS